MLEGFRERFPTAALTLHLHNTVGWGWRTSWRRFRPGRIASTPPWEVSGDCPYAPGASGNACTEDLVHMLEALGYATGVDLARLLACARSLAGIVGHDVPGQVAKAGRIQDLHPEPDWLREVRAKALERA